MLYIVFYLRFFWKTFLIDISIMHEQCRQNSIKNQE